MPSSSTAAMLAKGRLLGEQFLALLDGEDGTRQQPVLYPGCRGRPPGYGHPQSL